MAELRDHQIKTLTTVVIDETRVLKKVGYTTIDTIEVGDIIEGYLNYNRFIRARVDALPHTNEANLTFFTDQAIL